MLVFFIYKINKFILKFYFINFNYFLVIGLYLQIINFFLICHCYNSSKFDFNSKKLEVKRCYHSIFVIKKFLNFNLQIDFTINFIIDNSYSQSY